MRRRDARKSRVTGAKVDSLIGHGTEIHGDIHFSGGLHINGTIKGNVYAEEDSQAVAIVSERGRVEGELRVPSLLINGLVAGDVHASIRVDLARNARIHGDVHYGTMEMAGGAEVNGRLLCVQEGGQRFLERQEGGADADPAAVRADADGVPGKAPRIDDAPDDAPDEESAQ